jgi:uncharacterized protein Smg (DUF494 family)
MQRRPIITPPRISTMPRAQTEARMHLERYQMAIEKSRLEKELEMLEFRQVQIHARLAQLAQQAATTAQLQEAAAQNTDAAVLPIHQKHPVKTFNSESYQTFLLDF